MRYATRNLANINKLAPNTKVAAKKLHTFAELNGIDILIYETIRTVERQKELVAAKKSKTMRSYHIVGQALDFVPVDKDGDALWNGYNSPKVKLFIKEAKRLGFTWGADWDNDGQTSDETFVDSPHLQFEYKGYGTDKTTKPDVASKPSDASKNVYKGDSVVDYLKSKDKKSDLASRRMLARDMGMSHYSGNAEDNTKLLSILRKKWDKI